MNRDKKEVYTITIVRNFGVPLSFTIGKRTVTILAFGAALVAGFLLFAAVDYLVLRATNAKVSHQLDLAQTKMQVLTSQIKDLDTKYYGSTQTKKGLALYKNRLSAQPSIPTKNFWERPKGALSVDELQEGTAVDIAEIQTQVKGHQFNIRVKLVNHSTPDQAVGGYLCVTLVNKDHDPITYKLVTKGTVGKNGFPSSYKLGKQYFIKKKDHTRTVHQNLALLQSNEYYTSAMIFVYSYKGTLLNRSVHSLNKAIFLE